MHYFGFKKGQLYCENVKVSSIAKSTGTPVYIYSKRTIVEHYRKIDEAFKGTDHLICYALKANSNFAIIKLLQKEGCGADIVSGGELYKALKSGISPLKIVYAGVGKTRDEIKTAIKSRIFMFNIESMPEAERINSVAGKLGKKVEVALRINPDVDPDTHHYITTGKKENKFGINISKAKEFFLATGRLKNLKVCGIHTHIGSQITKVEPYIMALKKVIALKKELEKIGIIITRLNIGGGLGIIYKNENPETPASFAKKILPLLKPLGVKVILEPGRFIVGNSGIMAAQVQYIKIGEVKNYVILDAGMNDFIRPSLYGAYHDIVAVRKTKGKIRADVVGPICESGDFFGKNRVLPGVKDGDYMAVMSAGAYGFSMSSNYNCRRKPVEVLVDGSKYKVIRRRESFADLFKEEKA
ncbi:MAG: diaminopimelate decarboxylase [Candidatus Firestonebacteria bacterium RIFOXYC2_FULL_39_67]|nr:MAG: diaminopimelate decarboxylase [Candidatus Firestonebacteria bacterium RIFOXYD2_FULL_39_29]OGF52627.1 MAG: diaminopimelate decarboxylase [Candidatus Firestonebacteria bacterium RifOxyC12_full_39_7]OGF53961.1 MAG: diaminopimelate decarboxylase [Candidatus Firestonebacteria bacterium RIFOXYC2_FULL_39_67]